LSQISKETPVLGGYDAKVRIDKVCKTALAFDEIDEFSTQKEEPTEFLQSQFDSGNDFEDRVIEILTALFGATVIDCSAARNPEDIKKDLDKARKSKVVVFEGNREGNSRQLRADATHSILETPGKVTLVINARLWTDEGRIGEPDFLVRSSTKTGFEWLPGDVKDHAPVGKEKQTSKFTTFEALVTASAGDFSADTISGRAKIEDCVQLAHYRQMLKTHGFATGEDSRGFVIGRAVEGDMGAVLVDLDKNIFERNTASAHSLYTEGFEQAVTIINTARTNNTYDTPQLNSKCPQCGYKNVCRPIMEQNDELTLLAGLTPRVAKDMKQDGINSITELAQQDSKGIYGPHVDSARVWRYHQDTNKSHAFLKRGVDTADLALRRVTVFADFESTMGSTDQALQATGPVCYMWGLSTRISEITKDGQISTVHNKDQVRQFVTYDPTFKEEAKVFTDMWKYVTEARDMAVEKFGKNSFALAVYSGAESTILKNLARRHADNENTPTLEEVETFLSAHLIDQLKQMRALHWPASDYSLKSIAKHLGFSWSADDANGALSTEWYAQAIHGDTNKIRKEAKRKLEQYNEEDVLAQMLLADRLSYIQRIAKDAQFKPVSDLEAFYGPTKTQEVVTATYEGLV